MADEHAAAEALSVVEPPALAPPHEPAVPLSEVDSEEKESGVLLMSGVALIDWGRYACPTEMAALGVVEMLLLIAMGGTDWVRVGEGSAGLHAARTTGATEYTPLARECLQGGGDSVACALQGAGAAAAGLAWTALLMGVLLGVSSLLANLHAQGLLVPVAAKLPHAGFERALLLAPSLLWSALLLFIFLTLLVFATMAPSDEHGSVHMGVSFGLVRFAFLVASFGGATHMAFQHGVGEDGVIDVLDTLVGQWRHMSRIQKACQLAMFVALGSELLLWMAQPSWGWLLLLFGSWSLSHRRRGQLAAYQCAALLSSCTDTLTLASSVGGLVAVFQWLALLSKLITIGFLATHPEAFF